MNSKVGWYLSHVEGRRYFASVSAIGVCREIHFRFYQSHTGPLLYNNPGSETWLPITVLVFFAPERVLEKLIGPNCPIFQMTLPGRGTFPGGFYA